MIAPPGKDADLTIWRTVFAPTPEWMRSAACKGSTALFFPSAQTVGQVDLIREAKALCAACSVRAECLAFALEHPQKGIWGGTTERERRTRRASGDNRQTPRIQ